MFWVAGFDLIYALQDIDFDRKAKLYSVPSKLGSWPSVASLDTLSQRNGDPFGCDSLS